MVVKLVGIYPSLPTAASRTIGVHHCKQVLPLRQTRLLARSAAMSLKESEIKRNPHGDFKQVEASRPPFDNTRTFGYTRVPATEWKLGQGANDGGHSLSKRHIEIDPYEEGRAPVNNYKMLISGIVPRPIGFISTRSADGKSTNLAPFSYFMVIAHDPPTFTVGFASSLAEAKDTLRNLLDTKECTINIISEHYVEAANSTSINAPYGTSEWALSGLTPGDSKIVKPSFVKESPFAVEGRLMNAHEIKSPKSGKVTSTLAIIEGLRFHVREDAINEERNLIDAEILRPVSRLGGITYARVLDGMELPRPDFEKQVKQDGAEQLVKPKKEGQL